MSKGKQRGRPKYTKEQKLAAKLKREKNKKEKNNNF